KNSTNQLLLLKHRSGDNSAGASKFEERSARRIFVVGRLGLDISDLSWSLRRQHLPKHRSRAMTSERFAAARLGVCRRCIMQGNRAERITFQEHKVAEFRSANSYCVLQHGIKYRLKLAARP